MSNEAFTGRKVRIQCPPDKMPTGVAVSIVDAETGEEIPQVFRVVITLDAEDTNKAEIIYYESNEQGHLIVKDDAPVVQTATTNDFEVDITAFETKLESASKHDGNLDDDYRSVCHATVALRQEAFTDSVVQIGGGYGGIEERWMHLDPKQALSLLSWLTQEKLTLERLAGGR